MTKNAEEYTKEPKKKETREEKIARLKAQLQKEEYRLKEDSRKERNGQLVALGVLVEQMFKVGDNASRQKWEEGAKKHLEGRNLERVLAAFERLEKESKKHG